MNAPLPINENGSWPDGPVAILVSGGLDSAVLLGEAVEHCPAVHPLYVRSGLAWESAELDHLRRFVAALPPHRLRPLTVLDQPTRDVYGRHWSTTGEGVPGSDTPDEAVFLPGRNVLLLSKPLIWCHLHNVPTLALAPLQANPFPDATPEFFRRYQDVVNLAIGGAVQVVRPYATLNKVEVIRRGAGFALEHTFSCISPVSPGRHCGACNKCEERRRAFIAAEVPDPTDYARPPTE